MAQSPPADTPRISPYLLYEDAGAAIEWLTRAFGMTERLRMTTDDGAVNHAEMRLDDGVVLLGHPGPEYRNPNSTGNVHMSVRVYVDDVDAHYARAFDAGARIIEEPADQPYGERAYGALDLEGHHWYFASPLD
jgi:uncharacterized glyoxalase superfamily protein PhnB